MKAKYHKSWPNEMPVGLEETYDGVKVAVDITYKHTFQWPEYNKRVLTITRPSEKHCWDHIENRFAKPNLDSISRPETQHLYDMTRQSLKMFYRRGILKKPDRVPSPQQLGTLRLNTAPPTTPNVAAKAKRNLGLTKDTLHLRRSHTINLPAIVGQGSGRLSSVGDHVLQAVAGH